MITAYLIVDESGAKGYFNTNEADENEIGVMAGYLVYEESIETIRLDMEKIAAPYNKSNKTHITDLSSKQQTFLREQYFKLFCKKQIPWFYVAHYVKGFRKGESKVVGLPHDNSADPIVFNLRTPKALLHAKLFQQLFIKAWQLIRIMRKTDEIQLNVISDTLDPKTITALEKEINTHINAFDPDVKIISGYNRETKGVQKYKDTITVKIQEGNFDYLKKIKFTILCEASPLTLGADILSNSVYYYLMNEVQSNPKTELNSEAAILKHPLEKLVWGVWTKQEERTFFDSLYEK